VVIDARAHMLGRLASIVAKQILLGYHVVSALCVGRTSVWGKGGRVRSGEPAASNSSSNARSTMG